MVHDLRFAKIWVQDAFHTIGVKDLYSNNVRVKDMSSNKVRVQNLSCTRYGHRICPVQGTGTESVLYKVRIKNLSYTRFTGTGSILYKVHVHDLSLTRYRYKICPLNRHRYRICHIQGTGKASVL